MASEPDEVDQSWTLDVKVRPGQGDDVFRRRRRRSHAAVGSEAIRLVKP